MVWNLLTSLNKWATKSFYGPLVSWDIVQVRHRVRRVDELDIQRRLDHHVPPSATYSYDPFEFILWESRLDLSRISSGAGDELFYRGNTMTQDRLWL